MNKCSGRHLQRQQRSGLQEDASFRTAGGSCPEIHLPLCICSAVCSLQEFLEIP